MTHMQQVVVTQSPANKMARNAAIVVAGSIFLALMAQIAIPLPFTPIPLTLQTLAIPLLGAFLGSKRGALSVLCYLFQGTCGLPVFAGGVSNPLWFLDIKAGYLIAFVLAAYLVGKMVEQRPRAGLLYLLLAFSISHAVISFIGMGWISFYVGLEKAFIIGVLPFLVGSVIKTISGALMVRGYTLAREKLKS